MKFDFYLSEMSVSDLHGGGLTLQRVLGAEELDKIPNFIHVNRFATDIPTADKFLTRVTDIPSFWDSDGVRKVFGRTLANRVSKMLVMVNWHARYAAAVINKKFSGNHTLFALICPQGINAIYTLHKLQKHRSIKYITWIMDDHLIKYVNGQWQYPPGIEAVFAKHLQGAEHVFVISPAMQAFYKERFGISSTVLFGSADLYTDTLSPEPNPGKPLKIGYFGAVAGWQLDALKAVVGAINGKDAKLDIYSGVHELPQELKSQGVNFKGRIAFTDVLPTMQGYDAVLLPISFKDALRNMSQFNIATKMSEYLASGVPVLAVGPPYAAMINYLQQHRAAITVTSPQKEKIIAAFEVLRNKQQISLLLQNAQNLVTSELGSMPMRKNWLSIVKK